MNSIFSKNLALGMSGAILLAASSSALAVSGAAMKTSGI